HRTGIPWPVGANRGYFTLRGQFGPTRLANGQILGCLNAKSSEERVVYKRLNSTGTLIQRTTTEAPQGHMYYIGLDVHKKTISYCVKDASGQVHQEGKVGATRWELDDWMNTLPQPWTVAMEATIFTGWMGCDVRPECHMASTAIRDRRRTLRYRHLLVRQMVQMKNRISGLLMETGVSHNKKRLHKVGYFRELLTANEEVQESIRPLLRVSRDQIGRAS